MAILLSASAIVALSMAVVCGGPASLAGRARHLCPQAMGAPIARERPHSCARPGMPMRSIQLAFATHGTGVDVAATLPPGHTAFSWQGRALARPEGHTAFSWVDGAVAPAAGDDHAEARVAWAEVQAATVRTNMTELPAGVAKAKAALEHAHVTGSVLWRAPSTYYSWKLAERA